MAGEELRHDWWDPDDFAERWPTLVRHHGDGTPWVSCRRCGAIRNPEIVDGRCRGQVRVEPRDGNREQRRNRPTKSNGRSSGLPASKRDRRWSLQ